MPEVAPLHADHPLRLGRYRLTGRITGMPGSDSVFLGRGPDGSEVSISLLDGDWIAEAAERDRFMAEASAASRVAPLCAARILAGGFDAGHAFLVSEYVAGPSLEDVIASNGPWRGGDLEALAIGTATGLAAVHEAGLVHGKFGPEQVVLGPDGPRVIEFGISPPYGSATPSADMRAWANTVLYAAAGGPADARDLQLLPEPLYSLVDQCLATDPAERPSARSVVAGLLGLAEPFPGVLAEGSRRAAQAARPLLRHPAPPTAPPPARRPRRGVVIWSASIAAGLVVIAVAVVVALQQMPGHDTGKNVAARSSTTPARTATTPTPQSLGTVPTSLAGSWSGQVSQTGPSDVFSVQLRLASGGSAGTVSYSGTSLSCSGSLTVLSSKPGSLKLNQVITHGPCAGGVVLLTPGPNGTAGFSFQGKQGPAATGTLTRG
jgi:eukaryotic-like serine/threonine-protein kinase